MSIRKEEQKEQSRVGGIYHRNTSQYVLAIAAQIFVGFASAWATVSTRARDARSRRGLTSLRGPVGGISELYHEVSLAAQVTDDWFAECVAYLGICRNSVHMIKFAPSGENLDRAVRFRS